MATRSVLLVRSPDAMGLIHLITGILLEAGANIVQNSEFVDRETATFFMRTEFSQAAATLPFDLAERVRAKLPPGAWAEARPCRPKDCVILATREAHCLGDLLLRHYTQELPFQIRAVISQYADLEPLVARFGIPFHAVMVKDNDRTEHESRLLATLAPYRPDYLVLAKYMRILSAEFLTGFENRIVNIHHSFLPAFIGARPYEQAYRRGVKIIGATAHFVNGDLDQGPILTQDTLPVNHTHAAEDMAQAGRDVEKICLARALRLVFEDRVLVHGNRTIIFE